MILTWFGWHCFIGSLIWLVLDGTGVIENTFVKRKANGKETTLTDGVLATIMMVVAWPVFVALWLRGMWRAYR